MAKADFIKVEASETIVDKFHDRFTKLCSNDMGAAQALLAEFKVARLCKLEGKDFDKFDRRLTELGYGGEVEYRGSSNEVGTTRKTPDVKTRKPTK